MTGGLRVKAWPIFYAASLWVGRAIIEASDPRERNGGCAHGARLKRYIEIAIHESFRLQRFPGLPDGEYFGVRGHVVQFARAISGARNDFTAMYNNCADWYFSAFSGCAGFFQRDVHRRDRFGFHNAGRFSHVDPFRVMFGKFHSQAME